MNLSTGLRCHLCQKKLPEWNPEASSEQFCPGCESPYRVDIFPAMLARDSGLAEKSAIEGDASCFFHDQNKAVIPCSSCGRFLCSLCDIPFGEAHICPKCIERGQDREKDSMRNKVFQYDNMALLVAILPMMFFFWPALIGAPAALFLTIRYFREPCSILPRTKIRFYIAGLFALGELGFFAFLISSLVNG